MIIMIMLSVTRVKGRKKLGWNFKGEGVIISKSKCTYMLKKKYKLNAKKKMNFFFSSLLPLLGQ